MSYFSLYFISIRFTFIYFGFFLFFFFDYDKLMEHSVANTWSCSSFSFLLSGLDSHTQVPRIDSGRAGSKKLLDVMENDTKTNFQEKLHTYAYNNGDTISEINVFFICLSLYRVCSVLKNCFVQFNMAPIGHLSDQS